MPAGLAAASTALHNKSLLTPAIGDAAGFTPHLLTATGPDNGWLPAPVDGTQIAYGADAPASAWTGESQWSGSFVAAGAGSTVSWPLPAAGQPRLVQPIAELIPGSRAQSTFAADGRVLGRVRFGAVGPQGNAPSPTQLMPVDLRAAVPAKATTVAVSTSGGTGNLGCTVRPPAAPWCRSCRAASPSPTGRSCRSVGHRSSGVG